MRIETAADLKKITPPAKGNERHPVEGCHSLYFKITRNGAMAWTYRYRPKLGPRSGNIHCLGSGLRSRNIGICAVVLLVAKIRWAKSKRRGRRLQWATSPRRSARSTVRE